MRFRSLFPDCQWSRRTAIKRRFMLTVAEQLRTAREAQGLTVYQVAEITKIKTDHVCAREEGDYEAFAVPDYIRGYVRTNDTMLRLDVATVRTALETEADQT